MRNWLFAFLVVSACSSSSSSSPSSSDGSDAGSAGDGSPANSSDSGASNDSGGGTVTPAGCTATFSGAYNATDSCQVSFETNGGRDLFNIADNGPLVSAVIVCAEPPPLAPGTFGLSNGTTGCEPSIDTYLDGGPTGYGTITSISVTLSSVTPGTPPTDLHGTADAVVSNGADSLTMHVTF